MIQSPPPFRALGIVADQGQATRLVDVAHATPGVGFAMMIRDPGHDQVIVRALCVEIQNWALPPNLLPISNGVSLPAAAGVHWSSQQLFSGIARGTTSVDAPFDGIVGASVHTIEQLAAAERLGVDYLTVSPVFPPGGKSVESTLGLTGLTGFARRTDLPLFALGGIDAGNAARCIAAGAWGIAAISWFQTEPIDHISDTLTRVFSR